VLRTSPAVAVAVLVVACGPPRERVVTPGAAGPPPLELVATLPIESPERSALPAAADVWVDMIAGAHTTLDLAEFYLSDAPNSRLGPVIAAVEAALARGVHVRVLAEHSYVHIYPETLDRLARAGAIVRPLDLGTGGILHAKYFIVDGHDAYLGSQNFDWRALTHNLELGVRLRDPAIAADLEAIFAADWARSGGEPAPTGHASPSALVASPQGRLPDGIAWELPAIVARLDAAHASIRVQLLTYKAGDWDELDAPLRRAAGRGVQVELLCADWAERASTISGLQALARIPNIEVRLLTIPAWSGGFIPYARVAHAKLLVVDGVRGWLGTSNWERDYFYKSRNVGVLVDDAQIVGQLDAFFADAWAHAVRVDPDAAYTPPRISAS
jgi:phosphatidylserine/phosphatidylglycerophosphate/cardiolipin synthase-like enzyme